MTQSAGFSVRCSITRDLPGVGEVLGAAVFSQTELMFPPAE
jgi:hypothetical protein